MIDAKTRLFCVIGSPISHSQSPRIHNYLLDNFGINGCYLAFDVRPEQCKNFLEAAKLLNVGGISVTMPLKNEMAKILDLTETARVIGAVNTVIFGKDDRREPIGDNTDGEGFVKSFVLQTKSDIHDLSFAIYGTGGAAKAVAYSLAKHHAKAIYVGGRDEKKISDIYRLIDRTPPDEEFLELVKDADVIVNATPLGMEGTQFSERSPLDVQLFKNDAMCVDLVYKPLITPFGKLALESGRQFIDGLNMLIYQAILSFERWLEIEVKSDSFWELRSVLVQG